MTKLIGVSNNLIGIVDDKGTKINLIDDVIKKENEMNKFYTYLKRFANPKPASFFQTPTSDSMTTASDEGNVNYVNELKESNTLYRKASVLSSVLDSRGPYVVARRTLIYRDRSRTLMIVGQ
ncbi:hypothetical protein Plhal703r1_c13g0065461 [Plasmopara halstedii]